MSKNNIHTVPRGNRWGNKAEGAKKVSKLYDKKSDAVKAGRDQAKSNKSEHSIHNRDGKIGSKNSYGKDNHPPKG